MRYFLLIYFLFAVLILAIAGFRGGISRRPPIELFSDMDRQPKVRPQSASAFFADGYASRPPVPGTIQRAGSFENTIGTNRVFVYEEAPTTTGRIEGTTNWVNEGPFKISVAFLNQGQKRYEIFCTPCHSSVGDGKGITGRYGMAGIANLHDPRIIRMPDGEIFNAITHGSKSQLMPPYSPFIAVEDRWAIVAYVRALQRSRLGNIEDVPEQMRSNFK